MLRPMSETSPAPRPFNPRMHQGGKLSFRTRTQDGDGAPGDRLVVGGKDPPPLRDLVPAGCDAVEIEIGPGKGAFLCAATAAKPGTFVLGVEAAPAYAAFAASRLAAGGARNGLVLVDNGKLYLQDRVPEGALAAVHVYYPDPWPKRRHSGRRFFTADVPAVLARALRDGGRCYVATDNPAYGGQICRVLGSAPQFARDEQEERLAQARGPGHAFSPTNFERKYAEEGMKAKSEEFKRAGGEIYQKA